eukprot:scaffold203802_cov22-Prasinocladus_malaysianus.AAC.1
MSCWSSALSWAACDVFLYDETGSQEREPGVCGPSTSASCRLGCCHRPTTRHLGFVLYLPPSPDMDTANGIKFGIINHLHQIKPCRVIQ